MPQKLFSTTNTAPQMWKNLRPLLLSHSVTRENLQQLMEYIRNNLIGERKRTKRLLLLLFFFFEDKLWELNQNKGIEKQTFEFLAIQIRRNGIDSDHIQLPKTHTILQPNFWVWVTTTLRLPQLFVILSKKKKKK